MLPKKITLNERFREFLRSERKRSGMTADAVSEAIGKSQSWLAQIERGRLKTIRKIDLISLYTYISGESKNVAIETLNDKLQFIEITEKKNLISSDGNILNLVAFIDFNQKRGHLKFVGENLRAFVPKVLAMPISQIEANLEPLFSELKSSVTDWIIRAFKEMKNSFSDEISQTNLFITIKLTLDVYNEVCSEYGLDRVEVNRFDMDDLSNKLSNSFIKNEATKLKDINDYSNFEFDTVIEHFDFEEYMMWKNKNCYVSITDKMPMLFNTAKILESANYVSYEDIPSNLSSVEYLKIIRHLYEDLAYFYGKLKAELKNIEDLQEEIDQLTNDED